MKSAIILIFFFQAEDGIRDLTVTGVQTCALPISRGGRLGLGEPSAPVLPPSRSLDPQPGRGRMRRSVLVALLALAGACRERPEVAGPQRAAPRLDANLLDPALSTALASAAPTATLEIIVNYDETVTTRDAVTNAMLDLGAGVVQFKNLELVAGLATAAQVNAITALPGVQSVYLNKQLQYYGRPGGLYTMLLPQSVPPIRPH